MELTDLNIVIGLVGAPALIVLLVDDLRKFARSVLMVFERSRPGFISAVDTGSPWPLIRDLAGVGWAMALWDAGLLEQVRGLDEVELRWTTVTLLGLALGIASGKVRDTWAGSRRETLTPE